MEKSKNIHYEHLDSLFTDREKAISFVKENYKRFRNQKAFKIKYSRYVEAFLGNEVPSLFLKNDKRFLNNKPKNGDYTLYRYDKHGNIMSLTHFSVTNNGKEISDCTYYFFDYQEYKYAVPFLGESFNFYPSYTFKYKYKNNKIDYVAYISTSSLWLELYDWGENRCKTIHYIPNLTKSNKNVPVGDVGSPATICFKSLDFDVLYFSNNVYTEWIESFFNCCNHDKDMYIVINENYSSQYTICVFSKENVVLSDNFEFCFKTDWKSLLRRIITITKKVVVKKNIKNNVFVGFAEGEFCSCQSGGA